MEGEQPADLFAEAWSRLERQMDALAAQDSGSSAFPRVYGEHVERLRGKLDQWPRSARELRAELDAEPLRLMGLAQAIDRWYAPITSGRLDVPDALIEAGFLYRSSHRLNIDVERGQVILKRPRWGRFASPGLEPMSGAMALAAFFDTLIALPNEVAATSPDDKDDPKPVRFVFRHRPVADARSLDGDLAWRVGFASLIEAEEDVKIETRPVGGRAVYDVRPKRLHDRLQQVIRDLCDRGCHIIALPEMALHEASIAVLKDCVRRSANGSLALVLAGTSRRIDDRDGAGAPFNEAVVLDHTGEDILRQRKLCRWNLDEQQCHRYDIDLPPPGERRYEHITPGEEIVIVEQAGLGRLAVLVCEDLSRTEPGRWIRANLPLELQFTPVLDGPLGFGQQWEGRCGAAATRTGRCRVLVANSVPLTLRQNRVNARTERFPQVATCGIGMAIDFQDDGPRGTIASIDVAADGARVAILDWEPAKWSPVTG